jgi:hypothetical protein
VISRLHSELAYDDSAQARIDAHLLAAAACRLKIDLGFGLRSLVMAEADAPQYANLPDLGPVVRRCLVEQAWGSSFLAHCLGHCMPVPKPNLKQPAPDPHSCALLLNLLLATLLGLYPGCVKKPPFQARALLFARVHALLTANSAAQCAFAADHRTLLVFSLGEYVCRVLPAHFPAERESICAGQAVEAFFQQGPAVFESFRQDALDTGAEAWGCLSAAAQESHDRLCKTFRSKCRLPQHHKRPAPSETPQHVMAAALAAPKLVRYGAHRGHESALRDEYSILLGDPALSDVAVLHSLVKTEPLPESIRDSQVSPSRYMACAISTSPR